MISVLLVDDSRFVHEELKGILKDSSFEIIGYAKNGDEGLEMYETCTPDLVIMDIIMPGMDGIDALKLLRSKHPEAKVVIGSSLAYDETIEIATEAGASGVIFKPYDKNRLLQTLETAIHK